MTSETHRLLRKLKQLIPTIQKSLNAEFGSEFTNSDFIMNPPTTSSHSMSCFSREATCALSTQLLERFKFASDIHIGPDIWLGLEQVGKWTRKKQVLQVHRALRDNNPQSFPARFNDDQLSLLAVCPGVPDSLTYVAWTGRKEPIIGCHSAFQIDEFSSLNRYLKWQIESYL